MNAWKRRPLQLYVAHHPSSTAAETLAREISDHYRGRNQHDAISVPVEYRSAPADPGYSDAPLQIDIERGEHVAVVLLLDDVLTSSAGPGWLGFVDHIVDHSG